MLQHPQAPTCLWPWYVCVHALGGEEALLRFQGETLCGLAFKFKIPIGHSLLTSQVINLCPYLVIESLEAQSGQ